MAADELRPGWRETPHATRLSPEHARRREILQRHGAAIEQGDPVYADPISGFSVFTAEFLARRGTCCESGCRHCPFVTGDVPPPNVAAAHPLRPPDLGPDA